MRVDEETWDNIYDIPTELAPVIEELTRQNNSLKEAVTEMARYRTELINLEHRTDEDAAMWVRVAADRLGSILKRLEDYGGVIV